MNKILLGMLLFVLTMTSYGQENQPVLLVRPNIQILVEHPNKIIRGEKLLEIFKKEKGLC